MSRKSQGFSLVELMVVVSIIGILAGLSVPRFQAFQTKARLAEVWSLTDGARQDVQEFYERHGSFPASNAAAGQPAPEKIIGHYIDKVTIDGGAINVQLGNSIDEHLRGKVVTLRPLHVPGSPKSPVSWTCGKREVPKGLVPAGVDRTSVAESSDLPSACR